MPEESIIIIGAGIAGLSADCYGQMNGYKTQIFEMHTSPGGLCTAWKRQGYTFDGCIHWLVGSRPGSGFHCIWEELGAVAEYSFIDHKEFTRIEGQNGKTFIVYTDADCLEDHMNELSPADSPLIKDFANAVRRCSRLDQPIDKPRELYGVLDGLRTIPSILPLIGVMRKYKGMTVQDFASHFSDPFLRQAFALVLGMPDLSMLALIFTLGFMHSRNAGFPLGGSQHFSRAIERRYLSLRGEIRYKSRVKEILVEAEIHLIGPARDAFPF